LGGSSRCFKQPLTPKTYYVLRLARRTPANCCSEGSSTSSKVDPFCFSVPNCRLFASTCPPYFRGGDWLPISSVTIALPIVRAHIHPSPYSHSQRPYWRHPALDYLTPKPNRSCLYYSCKKLYYSQSATTLNLAAKSCTPK
jgi:hypothetical protein